MSLAVTRGIAVPDSDSTVSSLPLLAAVRYVYYRDQMYSLASGQHRRWATSPNRHRYVGSGSSDGKPEVTDVARCCDFR